MFNIFSPLDMFREQFQSVEVSSSATSSTNKLHPLEGIGVHRRQTECDVSLCEYTEWSDWTFCYCAICNEFDNTTRRSCLRLRSVVFIPDGCQDDDCELDLIGDLQCFEKCCNTHCGVTEWSDWYSCNDTCDGNGIESRNRSSYPKECFVPCTFQQTRPCSGYCQTDEWSSWSCLCDLCEPNHYENETITGTLLYDGNETLHRNCTRSRLAITPDLCQGCELIAFEENVCMENCSCDNSIACSVNEWGSWSACPATCGGNQIRTRSYSGCTGPPCVGTQQSRACTECATCSLCDYSEWSAWSSSTTCVLCNTELRSLETRSRTAIDADCDDQCLDVQRVQCGDACCDEVCVLSEWSEWTLCPEPCGGSQERTRDPMLCLGEPCSATEESIDCPECGECDLCEVSEWTTWTCACQLCDITVAKLNEQCSRTRIALNELCDASCFNAVDVLCNNETCCDEFCLISSWSDWGSCSESCGGSRNRTAMYEDLFCLGEPCQNTIESEQCVPCPTTEWSEWSCSCSLCQSTFSLADICIRERTYGTNNQCNTNCTDLVEVNDCINSCCDELCLAEDWGEWTTCPQPCGGTQNRTRQYSTVFCLGEPCEITFESQDCAECPNCTPVDCVLTQWNEWSECNNSCSVGMQTRSREITTNAECGGAECQSIDEARTCEGECQLSEWGNWQCTCSLCSGFVDSLYSVCTRERDVSGPSYCSSVDCATTGESGCTTDKCCDVFCIVSEWSQWSVCSSSCGSGVSGHENRTRTYNALFCIGAPCSDLYEERTCTPDTCCPVDCMVTQWSEWSACSVSCASENGVRTRSRQVTQGTCGGILCTDTSTAETQDCAGECQLLEWSPWSCFCWFCNTGDSVFNNVCSRDRQELGTDCNSQCGSLSETVCNDVCCDNNCITSEWSTWSSCDQPCGSILGNQMRTRTYNPAFCIGEPCNHLTETRSCDPGCCPVNCSFSEWTEWSKCSVICADDTGIKIRTRDIQQAQCGGSSCENEITSQTEVCQGECTLSFWTDWNCLCSQCATGDNAEHQYCTRTRTESDVTTCVSSCGELIEQECREKCCDPNCTVSDWGVWSECNVPCGSTSSGIKRRTRTALGTCTAEPCLTLEETDACSASCCETDCVLLSWEHWMACTSPCANTLGIRTRTRPIVQGACGGQQCTESDSTETGSCYGTCEVSGWSDWSCVCGVCTAGNILEEICNRYRNESTDISCSEQCGALSETKCGNPCCDELCNVGKWTQWTDCSEPCGSGNTGIQTRERSIISQTCRGEPCHQLSESRICFQGSGCCPIDCELGLWSTWSQCSANCSSDAGNQTRARGVITQDSCGGTPCDNKITLEDKPCYGTTYPANCIEGTWSDWSLCALDSGSCGTGTRQRTRVIVSEPICGGLACGEESEAESCQGLCCPVNCEMTSWEEWSGCSTQCGTGQQTRLRTITTASDCGGAVCEETFQSRQCVGSGPSECEFTEWSGWTSCSSSCGIGTQTRSRSILTPSNCRDKCSTIVIEQNQGCESYVNTDCQVGDWSQWSSCVPDCIGFTKTRYRNVNLYNSCNGQVCPSLIETSNCNIFCQHSCFGRGQCSCNSGYQLTGNLATECQIVTCEAPVFSSCPTTLTSGSSCVPPTTTCGTGTIYSYNHICQLSCELRSGYSYELQGPSPGYIQCLATGQWSYYTEVYCTIVNNPPTGVTTFSGNTIMVEENTFGNAVAVLRTDDVDAAWDAYTYTIVEDVYNIITIVDNQIYLRQALDYELQDK
ncbi:SCO-spondin-like [Anneissia japonica]|uniref:SCO-spondin-like n=1 Tax=Anneissia japonica TaxID=1529436 RepID=UPI00142553E8|nr:SCO-spondin-like [Anneissia japonica]